MKEEFIPESLAKKLSLKGYPLSKVYKNNGERPLFYEKPNDDPEWYLCNAWYLPTISQVLKWLREEKRLHIDVAIWKGQYIAMIVFVDKPDPNIENTNETIWEDESGFDSYEQAAIAGIEYVINNLI